MPMSLLGAQQTRTPNNDIAPAIGEGRTVSILFLQLWDCTALAGHPRNILLLKAVPRGVTVLGAGAVRGV